MVSPLLPPATHRTANGLALHLAKWAGHPIVGSSLGRTTKSVCSFYFYIT